MSEPERCLGHDEWLLVHVDREESVTYGRAIDEPTPVVPASRLQEATERVAHLETAIREHLAAIQDAWDGAERSPLWGLGDSLEAALDSLGEAPR